MTSWVTVEETSDFSLRNLPYGVFSTPDRSPRIGVAIGNHVLDLKALAQEQVFEDLEFDATTLQHSTINAYAGLGKDVHARVRKRLQQLLEKDTNSGDELRDNELRRKACLISQDDVTMHLPVAVGDFTDFFIGLHHAENCADFLKPGADITQLIPTFWDVPTAYHGRASSVVVSGTPIHRPKGQFSIDQTRGRGFCDKLDFEVEFAAVIGKGSEFGQAINVENAEDHIFGFVLLNDWSARDFQKYEMCPFNCKHFGTTISPWIVPFEALEPFRTTPIKADRPLPSHLVQKKIESAYDIPVKATLQVDSERYQVAECNAKHVVFSFAQMIAHHTRGGCPMRPGDILATGTVSGPSRQEHGCLLEISHYGADSYEMSSERSPESKLSRTWLEDGDEVIFTAQLPGKDGFGNVGFGTCQGKILPIN